MIAINILIGIGLAVVFAIALFIIVLLFEQIVNVLWFYVPSFRIAMVESLQSRKKFRHGNLIVMKNKDVWKKQKTKWSEKK